MGMTDTKPVDTALNLVKSFRNDGMAKRIPLTRLEKNLNSSFSYRTSSSLILLSLGKA